MLDMGLKLKCLREHRGLTQRALARESAVGEKTISSFETGQRLNSLKVSQLLAILNVLQVTLAAFVLWNPEDTSIPIHVTAVEVNDLPETVDLASRRRPLPVDPLRGFRRDTDDVGSPQSPLARAM